MVKSPGNAVGITSWNLIIPSRLKDFLYQPTLFIWSNSNLLKIKILFFFFGNLSLHVIMSNRTICIVREWFQFTKCYQVSLDSSINHDG